MMISRRPNKRASREYPPGPSKTRAKLIVDMKIAGSTAANRFVLGLGSQAAAMATAPIAVRLPARGVKSPIRRKVPLANASRPTAHSPTD